MAGDDVTITIRANSGDAIRAFRDVNGQLRDMRGRFVSEGSIMTRSMNQLGKSVGNLKGYLIPLATAGVPVIASLGAASVKTAGSVGGATLAVAAFGAAVAGQVTHLSKASDAQTKYEDAVVKSGRGSKEAAEAQRTLSATLARMPNSTARVAVAMQTLKEGFQEFSDSTADFTMTPVEKSLTLLGQVIPKLTPMAKGASAELDRLVTVAGGAVASPGFDALADKLSTFANESLKDAVDGIIHFSRALSEGEVNGPVKAFMDYAEQNGPAVRETLSTLSNAVTTLVQAAAEAGPGMLTLVNAAAGLVAALPPELVAVLMQTAVALKLVTLAGAGAAMVAGGVQTLGARITALGAASAAAGGGVAGLRAAFLALGTAAKASIVVGAIAAVVVALSKLGNLGREAPPDIDKLSLSLGQLGRTGRVSGEAARLFGKDLDGLFESVRNITDPSTADNVQNSLVKIFSLGFADSTPWQEARKRLDSVDEGLTNLVKNGNTEVAAAAFKRLSQEYVDGGGSLKDFTGQMDGYKSALADVKFEQDLIADSMGIFGEAAQDTSAKLDVQKQSADGLRASILALNDANRAAYDSQVGFEAAMDGLTESFKEHGATLNIDTKAGRENATAMSQAAKAHDEMLAAGIAAGDSLGSMKSKSDELRESMMRLATDAFDGNKQKAKEYVNELLGAPSEITTMVKLEREEAISGLEEVREAIRTTPDAKEVKVSTLNGAAIAALEAVGLKTKQLPDGRTAVFTANGQSLGAIGSVSTALNNLNGKTASTYVTTYYSYKGKKISEFSAGRMAAGGPIVGGSGVRDDVPILAMGGEYVINKKSTAKYGPLLEAINEDRLPRFAKGGKVSKAEREARSAARGDLTISYFGQRAGNKNTEFANDLGSADSLKDLVSSLNKWRSIIKKATHGGVEENLLKKLNSAGKALTKYEKQHDALSKTLEKAKALRDSVASGLKSEAGIVKAANASDSQVTINTLLSEMTGSAANTKQFSSMLTQLRKRGVDKNIIKQIAEAGIEGGGMETAAAILGGGSSEIKRLNALQKDIGTFAKSAGNAAADAMYGAGMKAGDGIIAGLEKKQAAIEKQMMKIAKAMEKSIKKALGIKSPSKVMEEVGDYTAEGFALGMSRNRSVMPAWQSMLTTPPQPVAPRTPMPGRGPASGWGDRPVSVTLQIGTTELGEVIIDPVRKAITTRGGLKATFPQDFR